jgi:hypothetical protein
MSTPESNPFESPEIDVGPVVRGRAGKGPRAGDFGQLMLQLCVLGGGVALIGALLSLVFWKHHAPIWILWVGMPIFVLGLLLVSTGRGLGAYKAWAWYLAVAVLVPLNLAVAAFFIYATILSGAVGFATLVAPAYAGYVLWTLLSKSGRESYWRSVAAVERTKADPNRVVRRRRRSR